MAADNIGYDQSTIEEYKAKIAATGKNFMYVPDDESTDEYAHFYFIGKHEEKEVVHDAVMYTLRLHHESEMFEIAEHRAARHFPQYKKISYEEDENGNLESLDDLEEEIGLFMAEVIMELEEEGAVKVQEHVEVDAHAEFGVGLDIGLHVETINDKIIEKFIKNYNAGTLQLDDTLYTFQTQDETIG